MEQELSYVKHKLFLMEQDLSFMDKRFYEFVDSDKEAKFNCRIGSGAKVPFFKKLFKAGWEANENFDEEVIKDEDHLSLERILEEV